MKCNGHTHTCQTDFSSKVTIFFSMAERSALEAGRMTSVGQVITGSLLKIVVGSACCLCRTTKVTASALVALWLLPSIESINSFS